MGVNVAAVSQSVQQREFNDSWPDVMPVLAERGEFVGNGIAHTADGVPFDPMSGKIGQLTLTKGNRTSTLVSLDAVPPDTLKFMWYPFIRQGINILSGKGGSRKSTFAAWICTQATQGQLRDKQGNPCGKCRVLYIDQGEDDIAAVLAPRFRVQGADLSLVRVYQATVTGESGVEVPVTTGPKDMPALRSLVSEYKPNLIVVDPLALFVDGDINSSQDVQKALVACRELADISAEGCALLGLHHWNKSGVFTGSQKFEDTSRSFMDIASDPDDGTSSIVSLSKANNSDKPSIRITAALEEYTAADGTVDTVQVIRDVQPSKISVDNLRQSILNGEDADDMRDIDRWLRQFMASRGGKVLYSEIIEAGAKAHYSLSQLKRAKRRIGAQSDKHGEFQGASYWKLEGKA